MNKSLSYLYFSAIGFKLFTIIGIITAIIKFKGWKAKDDDKSIIYKRCICLIIILVYEVILFNSTMGDKSIRSNVDITPLYELELELEQNIDIQRVMQVLQKEYSGSIKLVETTDFNGNTGFPDFLRAIYEYDLFVNSKDPSFYDNLSIYLYENERNAKRAKLIDTSQSTWKDRTIKVSDKIDVIKGKAHRDRSADAFFMLDNKFHTQTIIRINNIVFQFSESNGITDEFKQGRLTSTIIKWLCDAIEKSQEE